VTGVVNIGFSNFVAAEKIVAIVGTESAPIRRMMIDARKAGSLVNATQGHKGRSVILTETHVILSALQPEKVARRLESGEQGE
jgi:regulator of extracellular matrix RemA (YlzA/DUF370 family)